MWHCPHCGAPQAETARCWVCHRSSTTCSTCRHFRHSLAADVGWCALDPKRRALTGLEQRGCWQQPVGAEPPAAEHGAGAGRRQRRTRTSDDADLSLAPGRDFVPVELLGTIRAPAEPIIEPPANVVIEPTLPLLAAESDESWSDRTSLFGDLEA